MVIQSNNYDVSYSVNGGDFDGELKQVPTNISKSVEVVRVMLPKGKRTELKIRVTLMTGSNPTLHNAFVIDGLMENKVVRVEENGEILTYEVHYNLNEYINK